ncbi:MAG TPA: type II toxin-antitoxin system RelE/ParE family toxin, partial [Flavobacteriales bacterium]|nr:type II toxin-antitoxin system RelE/ParE family toxin [Flavobacteriales bacterium]
QLKALARKHRSLGKDLAELTGQLAIDPRFGTPLGQGCYKIRMKITSKGTGKSGGARLITHVVVQAKRVFLLSIFDKSEQESISVTEIRALLRRLPL